MGLERGLNCSRHSVSYIITPVTTHCGNSEMYVALGGANTTDHIKIRGVLGAPLISSLTIKRNMVTKVITGNYKGMHTIIKLR